MKQTMKLKVLLPAALAALLLEACTAAATMQVTETTTGPYSFVYREVTGDYSKNWPVFEELSAALREHGINPRRSIAFYLDDPVRVPSEKLRSVCGIIIEEEDWNKIEGLGQELRVQHVTRARRFVAEEKQNGAGPSGGAGIDWYPALSKYVGRKGFAPINYFEIRDGATTLHVMSTSDPAGVYPRFEVPGHDDPASGTVWPDPDWSVSTPEAQGMSSRLLLKSLDRLYAYSGPRVIDGLLITRHGSVVAEVSVAPNRPSMLHEAHSVTKSVIGALIGIAVRKGYIKSTKDRVMGYFTGESFADTDDRKRAMTIGDFLDMTSGLSFDEAPRSSDRTAEARMIRSRDWAGFTLGLPMAAGPGTRFNYSNGDTMVLSALLSQATGMTAMAFAQRELFGPLGIGNFRWASDPHGTTRGDGGLLLAPRDMAKLGYLFLRDGVWKGERLLPAGWTSGILSTSVRTGVGAPYYSRLWWVDPTRTIYSACGAAGQFVFVIPRADIVAVFTSKNPLTFDNYFEHYSFVELANELILPAVVSHGALPEDPEAFAALQARIRRFSTERKLPVPRPPSIAGRVSGRSWPLDPNPLGMESARLTMGVDEARLDLRFGRESLSLPVGLDGVYRTSKWTDYGLNGTGAFYSSIGRWENDRTFLIEWRALEGDLGGELELAFDADRVDLTLVFSDRFTWSFTIKGKAGAR